MTTGPSPEYVRRQLQSADEALSDAEYLLEGVRMKAASNRAYYAMFYAVRAALVAARVRMPKTHRGTINLFSTHYVRAGKVDTQFATDLQDAFDLRYQSDYEVYANVGEEQVREAVQKLL